MPKLFDEFDLDIQKVEGIELYSTDGGNSVALCDPTSNTTGCPMTHTTLCKC